MPKSLNRVTALAFGVGLAVVCAASAHAWPADDNKSATVRVPYDLPAVQTSDGAKRLASRIRHAAASVCFEEDPFLQNNLNFQSCRTEAIRRAGAQVNAPRVTEALGLAPTPVLQAAR